MNTPCTCPGCPRERVEPADILGLCAPCASHNHGHTAPSDQAYLRITLGPGGYHLEWLGPVRRDGTRQTHVPTSQAFRLHAEAVRYAQLLQRRYGPIPIL